MSALSFNGNMMPYYFGRVVTPEHIQGQSQHFCTAGADVIVALGSAPCMTAAKRLSSVTRFRSANERQPPTSLSGRLPLKTDRFSGRVSP